MVQRRGPRLTAAQKAEVWRRWREGESLTAIGRATQVRRRSRQGRCSLHGDQLGISLFPSLVIRRNPRPSRPIVQICWVSSAPRSEVNAMCQPFGE